MRAQLVKAIHTAIEQVLPSSGGAPAFGFALCTDDSVGSLFPIAASQAWADSRESLKFAVWPPEWDVGVADKDAFNALSKKLFSASQKKPGSAAWRKARDARFQTLVDTMVACQAAGDFAGFSYLCVTSTSPSNHMLALTRAAIKELNDPVYADAFREFLG